MSSETYHEPVAELSDATRDMHRALTSLMEELEAVDWYQQRAEATRDAELRAILEHNRDEEIEHAMMVLEWIRRKRPVFATNAATYLFQEGPITEIEAREEGGAHEDRAGDGSLGIGSLRTLASGEAAS
ncbi:MAG TPA: ferritin-like domain-containing protein [Planctomycetota bacterium]|nr:ferritin-like domain-containing protein [Planctomycetota bacterium]